VRSWLLIALMSGIGRLLRGGLLPPAVVGPLYAAIGAGLLYSSRIAWRRRRAAAQP
jgi:xanthine/uracil permease